MLGVWKKQERRAKILKGHGLILCVNGMCADKVPMHKVNFKARYDYEILQNYKVLQEVFMKENVKKVRSLVSFSKQEEKGEREERRETKSKSRKECTWKDGI